MKQTYTTSKPQIIRYLESLSQSIPGSIFWKDKNSVYLGLNKHFLQASGFKSYYNIIGKTDYELWPQFAKEIIEYDKEVMQTGQTIHTEEVINLLNGELRYFTAVKTPLRDDEGNIIGIIGNSIDITEQKTKSLNHYLELLAPSMPGPIYWKDKNSVYLGMNKFTLQATGISSFNDFIGKTDYELWPQFAEELVKHDQEVMKTGNPIHKEEAITLPNGEVRYFTAIKVPLRDDKNNIIGIIGNSIDITDSKEKDRLKIENEVQKQLLQEQENFTKMAHQVVHDIRSPLASLLMIVNSCTDIPEQNRIALREAAISINDIANNLLNKYKTKNESLQEESEEQQTIFIYATLSQLLTEKKYQYQKLPVKLQHKFSQSGTFAFIKVEASAFKRMISNLINNAVDALEQNSGTVTVKLDATNGCVKITIQDTGKGMPLMVVSKIMNNIAVTEGKKDGNGIGLTQVRETLQRNKGTMFIDSKVGLGTDVHLSFPRIKAPDWVIEEIHLNDTDIVVILDDDPSIHTSWDIRFKAILANFPTIQLKHFNIGQDTVNFINNFTQEEKKKIFLLTDFELLKQEIDGLNVVEQVQLQRSILVTSHYANPKVQERAAKTRTKILPKELAAEIPIKAN